MKTTAAAAKLTAKLTAKLIRRLEREHAAAIRREEACDDLPTSWRLAAASDRAWRRVLDARAGIMPQPPRTARNLAKGAFAALACIGTAVARAFARAASLRKAQAAAKVAHAARKAARLAFAAMRRAVGAIAAIAMNATKEIAMKLAPGIDTINFGYEALVCVTGDHAAGLEASEFAMDGRRLFASGQHDGAALSLRCQLDGDRFVFRGGRHGEHSISADPNITNAARLVAHWNGYISNNR